MQKPVSDFLVKFKAGSVDRKAGVIRDAVVAESGIPAKGHFGYLNADGIFSREKQADTVKTVPLFMDDASLQTALAAAIEEGGRARVRSDHDDALSARGGYADNFRIADGKLITDIHLFDTYKDREIVLETAEKTPDLIGLSMDFSFKTEVSDNKALVRVTGLKAVDIVDEGAVTPNGLFRSVRMAAPADATIAQVDTPAKGNMADTPVTDTPSDSKLDKVLALLTQLLEGEKKEADENETAAKCAAEDKKETPAEEKKEDEADKMAALVEKAVAAKFAALKAEQAALGVKPAAVTSAESTDAKFAAEKDAKAKVEDADPVAKFNAITADLVKSGKSVIAARHEAVKSHPEVYRASLKARGIAP